jgi:S1-C subfamily serine protease
MRAKGRPLLVSNTFDGEEAGEMILANGLTVLIAILSLLQIDIVFAQERDSMRQRVKTVKESTARILINGIPAGTGFAVARNLVATNFHVVEHLSAAAGGQTQVAYAADIQVQLADGRILKATPHLSVLGNNLAAAIGRDVALLTVQANDLKPLKLGRFADIAEGDRLYLAGYPFGIEQIVAATGILSTKWRASAYLGQGGPREVAWLDVTMNRGNSGGPVLLLADDPARDVVIGIANFSLNPFGQRAEEFASVAANFPGNAVLIGVDFKKFSVLIGEALASQSHGVGGCVAIDYLQVPNP